MLQDLLLDETSHGRSNPISEPPPGVWASLASLAFPTRGINSSNSHLRVSLHVNGVPASVSDRWGTPGEKTAFQTSV